MKTEANLRMQDREEAGLMLSKRLSHYSMDENAIVVATSRGGVCVAAVVASELDIPLETMCCRVLKHPAENNRNIGSVSAQDVVIHDYPFGIPQDYIYHRIKTIKEKIQREEELYRGGSYDERVNFTGMSVVLVADILRHTDRVLATLKGIRSQKPLTITLAVPLISSHVATVLKPLVDELIYLVNDYQVNIPHKYFRSFPKVKKATAQQVLSRTRKAISFQ